MNYSKSTEFNDLTSFNDSSNYSSTITFDVDKSQKLNHTFKTKFIHLNEGQYVIKSFNLIDKSGKIIYYVPIVVPDNYQTNAINTVFPLPILFSTQDANTTFDYTIIKK